MITDKDLMIDDWITIVPFHDKKKSYYKCIGNGRDLDAIFDFQGHINSIPITPEILEKNGFDKGTLLGDDVWTYSIKDSDNFDSISLRRIKYNKKHKWSVCFSIYGEASGKIFIDNVHELHHVLQLCKIKKKIRP